MARVRIRLYASLSRKLPGSGESAMDLREGITVAELLLSLGIRQEEAVFVIVNGQQAAAESVLSDGDSLEVFPMLGGG